LVFPVESRATILFLYELSYLTLSIVGVSSRVSGYYPVFAFHYLIGQ